MAQKKPPRILFNPDHMEVARDLLSNDEAGRLFFAIYAYAMEGKLPENESKSFNACFKLMSGEIDENARRYNDRCERNRQNVKKRWEQREMSSSDAYDGIPSNTTAYDGIPSNTTYANEYETYLKEDRIKKSRIEEAEHASAPILGFDGTDLTADMENCSRADELVQRYKLPDTDQSREALLEDAAQRGWDVVESTLKRASLSNARQMVSVNFYRRFFEDVGQGGKRCDSFADYGYERF